MPRLPAPPTIEQWRLDGELRGGHTVAETIAYAAWVEDYHDELAAARKVPHYVISPTPQYRLAGLIRRLFGR